MDDTTEWMVDAADDDTDALEAASVDSEALSATLTLLRQLVEG